MIKKTFMYHSDVLRMKEYIEEYQRYVKKQYGYVHSPLISMTDFNDSMNPIVFNTFEEYLELLEG